LAVPARRRVLLCLYFGLGRRFSVEMRPRRAALRRSSHEWHLRDEALNLDGALADFGDLGTALAF
jgi:hypothetical protein